MLLGLAVGCSVGFSGSDGMQVLQVDGLGIKRIGVIAQAGAKSTAIKDCLVISREWGFGSL